MKVVINRCYGGFGLSHAAMEALIARGWTVSSSKDLEQDTDLVRDFYPRTETEYGYILGQKHQEHSPAFRSNPGVIAVVEELGSEKASGNYAELVIVEIPDDVKFTIEEYDGMEHVAEVHRTWDGEER